MKSITCGLDAIGIFETRVWMIGKIWQGDWSTRIMSLNGLRCRKGWYENEEPRRCARSGRSEGS